METVLVSIVESRRIHVTNNESFGLIPVQAGVLNGRKVSCWNKLSVWCRANKLEILYHVAVIAMAVAGTVLTLASRALFSSVFTLGVIFVTSIAKDVVISRMNRRRTLDFENDRVAVVKAKIAPGEVVGLHRDEYPHIVIALQGGTITRLEPDGTSTDVVFPTGVAVSRNIDPPGVFHKSVNRSAKAIELIIIKFKPTR